MNFLTIEDYFNKLASALLLMLIVPLTVFAAIYFHSSGVLLTSTISPAIRYLLIAIVAADWVIIFVWYNKKIKSIRKDQGLRVKLEKYFRLTIVRYLIGVSGALVLAGGFYISHDDVFTSMFIVSLGLLGVVWPTAAKVCRDLDLRGDEREMVYYKNDSLS